MWQTSPSIVHQDAVYSTCKQFGIDFSIGKNKKAEKKAATSSEEETKTPVIRPAAGTNNPGKLKS